MTNAFSKKMAQHVAILSLYFLHYNFCRIHKTLRVTPAMEAGLDETVRGHGVDRRTHRRAGTQAETSQDVPKAEIGSFALNRSHGLSI